MKLTEKLGRLRRETNLALYKWSAFRLRIAGSYIRLSDLRLNILACNKGRVYFCSAAPTAFMDYGRSVVKLMDEGLITTISGARTGVNILPRLLNPDTEEGVDTRLCDHMEITENTCPHWIEEKVLSIGCSSRVTPVSRLLIPEFLRITRKPETLRPVFNNTVMRTIGGKKTDSVEALNAKFLANLELFGTELDEGWVIPSEYVSTGGCLVVPSGGISMKGGSVVCKMPLTALQNELRARRWKLHLGDENGLD